MPSDQVQSLQRAFLLLSCLETAGRPLSLQELSARSGLPKSTVHRLLSTLGAEDFIEQSNLDGHYRLGLRLLELGSAASNARSIINIAKPYMQRIVYEINESVCLALLSRGEVLILEFIESSSAFHVVSRVGARLPAHCTVQGKIMLAFKPASEVRQILRKHGMRAYTPNTLCTYEQLTPELEQIRRQGYALDNSEFHVGLYSIAAPIYDAAGNVEYSFAVVSMFHKIASAEFAHAKALVLEAASAISRALGYRGDD